MGSDKPDVDEPDGELDDHDKPVSVPLDVEHIVLVSDGIRRSERFPYIGETSPFAPFHDADPLLQGHPRIGMSPDKLLQGLFSKDSHIRRCKDKDKFRNLKLNSGNRNFWR
jgi:hypothetical protein